MRPFDMRNEAAKNSKKNSKRKNRSVFVNEGGASAGLSSSLRFSEKAGVSIAAWTAVTLASGPLYDRFGVDGFLAMIPIAIVGLMLIGLAARSAPQRPLRG